MTSNPQPNEVSPWQVTASGRDDTAGVGGPRSALAADVRAGLSHPQKALPPKYFYDARGSALFEEITRLDEYYLTRAERAILERHAAEIVVTARPRSLVELGAGSSAKTRVLLDAIMTRRRELVAADRADAVSRTPVSFIPVDVSANFLAEAARALRREYPALQVTPTVADISVRFQLPPRPAPTLIAFLGSTIGNFEPADADALIAHIASLMHAHDYFLLGADLIKDRSTLERAYNDSRGVTADFNLNVLRVLNRELGANFELERFSHRAVYNERLSRIEMHLDSTAPQLVHIPDVGDFAFRSGESLLTEVSYKYDRTQVERLLSAGGLVLERWMIAPDELFALALARSRTAGDSGSP